MVTIAFIFALVGPSLMYIDWIFDQVEHLPIRIAALMSTELRGAADIPAALAATVDPVLRLFASGGGGVYAALLGTLMVSVCTLSIVCAWLMLYVSQIGLALLVAIGPFVILGLPFKATHPIFEMWLKHVITLTLVGVFVMLTASIGATIATGLATAMEGQGGVDGLQIAGAAAGVLSMGLAYLGVSAVAGQLGGGIASSVGSGLAAAGVLAGAQGARALAGAGAAKAGAAGVAKVAQATGADVRSAASAAVRQEAFAGKVSEATATLKRRGADQVFQQQARAASRAAAKEAHKWRVQNS
ncbi:MAG: type IV secretion system protein [Gammaproteobacteria bacterium]|nr:type IV secretion system protein [Gammaproteobacteria bacterium]